MNLPNKDNIKTISDKEKKQDKCDHYFLPSGGKWSPEGQKTCQDCGKKIGT